MKEQQLHINYRLLPREEFDDALIELEAAAIEAARNAYAPYSRFFVGASLRLEDGTIVTGSNQENASYPQGICAERNALFHAGATYPDRAVKELLIVAFAEGKKRVNRASPCGGCRQVILETSTRYKTPIRIILPGERDALILEDNSFLLPFGFDASFLS